MNATAKQIGKNVWGPRIGGIVGLLLGAFLVVYLFFPQFLLKMVRWQYMMQAQVSLKSVQVGDTVIPYYEGGKKDGETLVLIHGFGDSKVSFLQTGRWLRHRFHIIMPDVPGFGETKKSFSSKYGVSQQIKRFHLFFKKLGLKKFHLGGNSMGGHISAAYAITYPQQVKSLLLLNAAGVRAAGAPLPYKKSKHPIRNKQEFEAYLKTVFVKRPTIPGPFVSYFIQRSMKNFNMRNKISADLKQDAMHLLNDKLSKVNIPTLVLWGDGDKIVDIRIGREYHKLLPRSRWVVMKQCGHTPQYERPKETAQHLISHILKSTLNKNYLLPARKPSPVPAKR